MFENCCHCHDQPAEQQKNQITYDPVADPNMSPDAIAVLHQQPGAAPAAPEQTTAAAGKAEEPPLSQRSQSSLTPEEKAAEKARLQELVKNFAKNAVQGMPSQLMDEGGGLVQAKYQIDKHLKKMTICQIPEGGGMQHVVPLSGISEIYRIEDGEGLFPTAALNLQSQDIERVLMVMYTDDYGQAHQFCFFEASAVDKERFLTCMKILRLYSQTNTPKSS